jgi:hypothetical protein
MSLATGFMVVQGFRTFKAYETLMTLQKENLKYVEKECTIPWIQPENKKNLMVLTFLELNSEKILWGSSKHNWKAS